MKFLGLCLAACLPAAMAASATAKINLSNTTATVPEQFSSFGLDWWLFNDTRYGDAWGNDSALTIDLQDASLKTLLAGLAPAYLRLGGSPEDSVLFDADGTCEPGQEGFEGYSCSQTGSKVYGCLRRDRWKDLLQFASDAGVKIMMGLNACIRQTSTSPLNTSNAEALMRYTVSEDIGPLANALAGFEVGNEVDKMVDATTWGHDVANLAGIARTVWGSAPSLPKPFFVAPDIGGGQANSYFDDVMTGANGGAGPKNVSAMTYHQYPNCVLESDQVLEASCLQQLDDMVLKLRPVSTAHSVELWAGEGADHVDGGINGLTNTFTSSFYTAYRLATFSKLGVSVSIRQTLAGGWYGLAQTHRQPGFLPNPDYWITWLWKKLMGPDAFDAVVDSDSAAAGLRVFANSPKGSATTVLTIINLSRSTTFSVDCAFDATPSATTRSEWHITGDVTAIGGDVFSNGDKLVFDGTLPAAPTPAQVPVSSPVSVAPASIVFVQW